MSLSVERATRVRCSVEHAFETFVGKLDRWWPAGHRRFQRSEFHLEAHEGGRFFERSDGGEEAPWGKVVTFDRPHRLVLRWFPGAIDRPTEVEVRFEPDGDHTRVAVTHSAGTSGLGDEWPERARLFERGWDTVLPAFADHLNAADDAA